ncbi:MAG: peroxiredoxin [Bdellovibrionota bacterium]
MNFLISTVLMLSSVVVLAGEIKLNDPAPLFSVKTQTGADFDLKSRKGKWTVLYFYPKAGTPGCTKQACAFRDSIQKIRDLGAEVYGISTDTVEDQAKFHKEHRLNFDLLADADAKITNLYGSKMPVVKVSKRWTFVIDPDLKIRNVMKDVDPVLDSERVASEIAKLKAVAK